MDNEVNIRNKYCKYNITKWLRIPTDRRRTAWLIYKYDRGDELGTSILQLQLLIRTGPELSQCPNHSATLSNHSTSQHQQPLHQKCR